ncbi:MAG: hypothetical protein JW920_11470 [Deltaproteobacteria bacterium]|nr:hypothetical protein [Deltaproteobacteria bacterium]
MTNNKIVARFSDGRVLKGVTHDFAPNKPSFHLFMNSGVPSNEPIEINISDLKAVFFVKDYGGNSAYNERKDFLSEDKSYGKKVKIVFSDGEILAGTSMGIDLNRPGLFLAPADPQSNNSRIFVVSSAVKEIQQL